MVMVFAIFWALITIMPLVLTLMSSFKTNEEIFGNMFSLPEKLLVSNYIKAFVDAKMGRSILNSFILASCTSIIVVIIAILASYVLARKTYFFIKPIYMLFILGIMIPVHTTLISISRLASSLNGLNQYWFLILVYATFQLPQAVFLMTGYIKTISKELDEAAIIDGFGTMAVIFRIILPISSPIIATVSIITFMYAYSELIFSIILLTDVNKYPISRALMFFIGERTTKMGPLFASIMLAIGPMLLFYIILHEKIQKGMSEGSVKG